MNRTRVLADAKARALAMVTGYVPPPEPAPLQLPGATARAGLAMVVAEFHKKGIATAHDVTVATQLARVVTGGDIDIIDPVPQSAIMDLEREAFMALFRTKETQARIKHIIDTGKPLRN